MDKDEAVRYSRTLVHVSSFNNNKGDNDMGPPLDKRGGTGRGAHIDHQGARGWREERELRGGAGGRGGELTSVIG